ncbi:MAG: glycosyltransferase [Candidatus Omnitrophica bacterium]|nr:glycosyltransferase [Candidatus Omnitrophota bacterium]
MKNNADVSIIILTKNAQENIKETLDVIFRQASERIIEVIVIDSGSSDNTIEIIRSFSAVLLVENPPEVFQHGRTRNLGGNMAQGKYIVFLNGDAVPLNKNWLEPLINDLEEDDSIVGVYSRHIPKKNCYLYMEIELISGMRPVKEIIRFSNFIQNDKQVHLAGLIRFSTVSCAIKKSVWDKMPFTETLPIGEDQDWAKRMLEAGYAIAYEPASVIIHSHNYTLTRLFKYRCANLQSFNAILGRKKSFFGLLCRILISPISSIMESIVIFRYAKGKKYGTIAILKEIYIAFLSRLVASIGELAGNK